MDDKKLWQYLNRRQKTMWSGREGLDDLDLRIARTMCPELASGYLFEVTELGKEGVDLGEKNVNPTVYECVDVASSGFQSHLTNPARKWFALGSGVGAPQDETAGHDGSTRGWYDDATAVVEKVLAASGTYNALHEAYRQLVLLGRCCILRTEDLRTIVRHTTLIPGTFAFGFDEAGEVDSVVRKFALSPAECVAVYGRDLCDDTLLDLADRGDDSQKQVIWQLIERHRDGLGHPLGDEAVRTLDIPPEHAWRSIHFSEGSFKRKILRVAGFKRSPILAPRYSVSGGNLYGVGIGKRMLPSAVGLQTATRMLYEAVAQCVRPPVNAPAEMKEARISLGPGGVNYYTTSGSGQATVVSSVYATRPDLQAILLTKNDMEQRLARGFLNHLFMSLDQIRERAKTAYETEQVLIEARQVLGPVITVWDKELLDPLVMGVFEACVEAGVIAVPEEIAQGGISPQYTSLIHMAQRATGLNNMQTFLQIVGGVAQLSPEAIDNLDGDGTLAMAASMLQVPERMLRQPSEVQSIREGRAQAQQAQAAMQAEMAQTQMAQAQAGIVKELGALPSGNDAASLITGTAL